MIDTDYARCDIGEPAQFVCGGDTAQAPAADPLPYGESIIAGQMSCESAESGITCRDAESGAGFTISREAYGALLTSNRTATRRQTLGFVRLHFGGLSSSFATHGNAVRGARM